MFFGLIGKPRWPPWSLIYWDVCSFFFQPLNWIQWNFTGGKISMSFNKFVFTAGPIGKPRLLSWPLIGWDIVEFFFYNRWNKFNETLQEAGTQSQCPLTDSVGVFIRPTKSVLSYDIVRASVSLSIRLPVCGSVHKALNTIQTESFQLGLSNYWFSRSGIKRQGHTLISLLLNLANKIQAE